MPVVRLSEIEDADENDNWMGFRKTLAFDPKYLVYHMDAADHEIEEWIQQHPGLGKTMAYLSYYRIIVFVDHQDAIDCTLRLG